MKTIVCANQKGGATKTSTSAHIAAAAALRGFQTVLVDLDGQCNLTELFGVSPDELADKSQFTVLDVVLGRKTADKAVILFPERFGGNLGLVPGHQSMNNVGPTLELAIAKQALDNGQSLLAVEDRKDESRLNLKKGLAVLEDHVDLVVIDPPPSLGFELVSALACADAYVVPCTPNKFDLSGFKRLNETVGLVQQKYNPALEFLGVILSRVRGNTTLHKDTIDGLEARFGDRLLRPYISECIRFGECPYHGKTLYELVPNDPASKNLEALADGVLERLGLSLAEIRFTEDATTTTTAAEPVPSSEPVEEAAMGEVGNG